VKSVEQTVAYLAGVYDIKKRTPVQHDIEIRIAAFVLEYSAHSLAVRVRRHMLTLVQ